MYQSFACDAQALVVKDFMGIRDRDYMKRRSDDEADGGSSLESKAEAIAERIMAKRGKLIAVTAIALGIFALVLWIVSKVFGGNH
ncbi:MAG TPA: hypothetical protein VGY98_04630 [Verrucomicrobiae bacterium]|nr:hypothetical protein [Verrucomicrobiae bacterium]